MTRTPSDGRAEVRAAGGVLVRATEVGDTEVGIVHREKYDDWTLPKGKLDRGETWEQAALREVEEETGMSCELGAFAGESAYCDRHGRGKVVRYWTMHPRGGAFRPNREVDELRWLAPDEAKALLTYDRDRDLVDASLAKEQAGQR